MTVNGVPGPTGLDDVRAVPGEGHRRGTVAPVDRHGVVGRRTARVGSVKSAIGPVNGMPSVATIGTVVPDSGASATFAVAVNGLPVTVTPVVADRHEDVERPFLRVAVGEAPQHLELRCRRAARSGPQLVVGARVRRSS